MRTLLTLIIFFLLNSPVLATDSATEKKPETEEKIQNEQYRFTPHISAEAITRAPGKLSLQRAVGANLNTNLFLSSLNIGVTKHLEIGTIAIHYFNKLHQGNFSFKYNFWRSKHFLWSFGFNYAEFLIDEEELDPEFQNKDIGVGISSVQLLLNYFPDWTPLRFGLNVNGISTHLTNVDQTTEKLSLETKYEFGLDISYPFHKSYDATLGLGWLREKGVSALEEVEFGFGASFRWYRPKKFISSPTIGAHYTPETNDVEFLFSTSLY